MKLIYLGMEFDTTREQEILSDNKNGFKITVTYKKDSWMSKLEGKQVIDEFNNYTEVHYLFSSLKRSDRKIAFESDILRTGFNRDIDDIESVVIENSTSILLTFNYEKGSICQKST